MSELDPALAELLGRAPEVEPGDYDLTQRRDLYRALLQYAAAQAPEVAVAAVEDVEVDGAEGPLPARVYRPERRGPVPTLVFFHGGGFVIGDVAAYDHQCRTLCAEVGAVVLSVDYRLAPEHPFPAAIEDALAAVRWAALHVSRLGGDPHRLAVGGDSAGANLSTVVAQELRGPGPRLAAQLLLYPGTDFVTSFPSHAANGQGRLLTATDLEWFRSEYLADGGDPGDPRVSPALADDLSHLPPAVVATAEYDPLVDDGDAYAARLGAAGNRVVHRRFEGVIHVFFGLGPLSPACADAARTVCADLRELLG